MHPPGCGKSPTKQNGGRKLLDFICLSAMNNLSPIQRAQWLKENQSEIIQNAGTGGAYDYLFKQINANEADTALVNLYNEMNSLPTKEAKNSWLWENRDYILGTYGQGVYDQLMKEIYG